MLVPKYKAQAIKPGGFIGVDGYTEESIKRDVLSVETKKARIKEQGTEPSKRAQLLEALFAEGIELNEWGGPDAMTIVPSDYDDLYNGIDLAIELPKDAEDFEYLAMGIDVTSSPDAINKKLSIIKKHIKDGTLTEMKYFESERNEFKGRMPQIPNIVIGAEGKSIQELAELWLTVNQGRLANKEGLSEESIKSQKERIREAQKKLAGHRLQILLLEQIEKQLSTFLEFAKKIKKQEIVGKYETFLKLVRGILSEKEISDDDQMRNEEDKVSEAMDYALNSFDDL